MLRWNTLGLLAGSVALVLPLLAADKPATDPAALEFFEKKVRPVLVENCYQCHSDQAKSPRGSLRLDSRAAMLKGGDNGPAIVPGDPGKSRLIGAVHYQDVDLRMPPKAKLPDAAIADLTAWVKMGAPWPGGDSSTVVKKEEFDLHKRKREHWAWQPIRSPNLPAVKNKDWPRSPSDRFILAKLEEKGLTPAPTADPRTLIRRLHFDLIGLPPAPEEVEEFVRDYAKPQAAMEKAVDRLLASPHFGERWGRHWLDLMRYAESRGHEFDYPIPHAFQYRDYVIRAFNGDVPYNQFVIEHVAGDLVEKPRLHPTEGFNESILGTGFWFLGEEVHSPVDIRQDQADRFDNRIDVLTKTFLGLTVSCARCHDHKFDAISTKDYYALAGFLESSNYRQVRFDSITHNQRIVADLRKLRGRHAAAIEKAVVEVMRPATERLAEYLLAARQVIQTDAKDDALKELARKNKLDEGLLQRWVAHLRAAVKDVRDPMHAWAKPEAIPALVEMYAKEYREIHSEESVKNELIVDFWEHESPWLPDQIFYPILPGRVRLGTNATRPIVKVSNYLAAEIDPTWNVLKLAPNLEKEPGKLGELVSAGRTIRTPTFTIKEGKVYYLVRGTGRAYAAVGQHTLINGPLHGQLVQPIKTGDRFQWIAHDLSAYKGLRTHLEFTAAENTEFAVARVMQGTFTPKVTDFLNVPMPLEELLDEAKKKTPEALAESYQRLFLDMLDRFPGIEFGKYGIWAGYSTLTNWMVQHQDLFTADKAAAEKKLAEAAGPFLAELAKLLAQAKLESRLAPAMQDGTGVDEHVFIRGSPKAPGELVPRRFLEALAGPERLAVKQGSGRLELAQQMTDPTLNPFISRVIVNRVWHHLFGRGIVTSVDNFGVLGEAPTHPELLDYLADQFVKEGWSIKKLIRALVLSSAYQMSTGGSHPRLAQQADPQNLLLHRMRLRRLEGEAIRDAMLAVSGRLDGKMYGPSVPVHLTAFQDGRGKPASGPLDGNGRRSIYLAVRRNFLSSMLLAFDTPIPFSTVGRRTVSNVPAQALILMNDPFVHQQADLWAKRVLAQQGTTEDRITRMYLSAFGRPPTEMEKNACLDFLKQPAPANEQTVWKDLAHVLFNAKEFIYVN